MFQYQRVMSLNLDILAVYCILSRNS